MDDTGSARAGLPRTSIWGAADQAIYSATNFGLAVLVAGVAGGHTFGAFAAGYVAYTLLLGTVEALTAEVFTVVYGARGRREMDDALRAAAGAALLLGLVTAGTAALVAAIVRGALGSVLVAFAVFLPALFVQDVWRFAFFAEGRPQSAACNDFVWGVVQATFVGVLVATDHVTVIALIVAWGASGAIAALLGGLQAGAVPSLRRGPGWLRTNAHFGARFAGEFLLLYGSAQVVLASVGFTRGLEQLARLRVAQLAFGPLQTLLNAARVALTAVVIRARALSADRAVRLAAGISCGLALAALLWAVAVLAVPDHVGRTLLGSSWIEGRTILPAMAVTNVAVALGFGPLVFLRASMAARRTFATRAAIGTLLLTLGVGGGVLGGARGAAIGVAIANTGGFVLLTWQARIARSRGIEDEGPSGRIEPEALTDELGWA